MTVSHAVSVLLDAIKEAHPEVAFPTICLWDLSMEQGPFDLDPYIKIVVQHAKIPRITPEVPNAIH